jgi:hypothetical protein
MEGFRLSSEELSDRQHRSNDDSSRDIAMNRYAKKLCAPDRVA